MSPHLELEMGSYGAAAPGLLLYINMDARRDLVCTVCRGVRYWGACLYAGWGVGGELQYWLLWGTSDP